MCRQHLTACPSPIPPDTPRTPPSTQRCTAPAHMLYSWWLRHCAECSSSIQRGMLCTLPAQRCPDRSQLHMVCTRQSTHGCTDPQHTPCTMSRPSCSARPSPTPPHTPRTPPSTPHCTAPPHTPCTARPPSCSACPSPSPRRTPRTASAPPTPAHAPPGTPRTVMPHCSARTPPPPPRHRRTVPLRMLRSVRHRRLRTIRLSTARRPRWRCC